MVGNFYYNVLAQKKCQKAQRLDLQTLQTLPLTALFTQQTSVFGFVCSTKRKGLGTNLIRALGNGHEILSSVMAFSINLKKEKDSDCHA